MVNLNDSIYRPTTCGGKPAGLKFYRHSCDTCGSDRGYQAKSFKQSWNLNNLQPMWKSENAAKGARYAGKFQQERD